MLKFRKPKKVIVNNEDMYREFLNKTPLHELDLYLRKLGVIKKDPDFDFEREVVEDFLFEITFAQLEADLLETWEKRLGGKSWRTS